ncbi:MAG TPA: clostripain-related cysteine peptidase [Planctomycetota bacterium]|nr:clostripain-related cysteine peptidase [Planctomycetota bacterium]
MMLHALVSALLPFCPPQSPETATPARAWTFAIYAAIDNNAEADGNFFAFFDGVRRAFADEPGIEIVLFADRSDRYSTNASSLGEDFTDGRLYRVRAGTCERLDGGAEFPEITTTSTWEPDSADPENVRKLLAFAKARYPSKHRALMLYGHADGRAMCPDEQSRHEMGFAQLTDVVPAALSVDLMALELCNMGGIEIAYQWRPGNGGFATRYLVAIPNAGPPLDWDRVFTRVHAGTGKGAVAPADLTPAGFAQLIVEEGGLGRKATAAAGGRRAQAMAHEAVAAYDLERAAAVKKAMDAMAVQLAAGGANAKAICARLRGPGPDGHALDYGRQRLQQDPFVDLYDFSARAAACEALTEQTRAAATAVMAATDEMVLASFGGSELPRFQASRCGVYFVFPPGDDVVRGRDGVERSCWARCRWYSPLPVPGVFGRLHWCRDGAVAGNDVVENWFELLDAWFDGSGANDSNGYRG